MSTYLIWWVLLKHLREFSAAQPELTGVDVRAGAKKPKDPYPCVEFIWDDEDGMNLYKTKNGELTLYVDTWIRGSDKDPAAGYDALFVLMEKTCAVIVRWSDAVIKEMGIAVNLSLSNVVSSADITRPLCGSRMVLKIEWRKSRYV